MVERLAVIASGEVVLVRREGDQLLERQRGIVSLTEAVTFYGHDQVEDAPWEMVIEVGELPGLANLGEILGIRPERSHQYLVARSPSSSRRATVLDALKLYAVRRLADAGLEIPEEALAVLAAYARLLRTQRQCDACGERLRGDQERWCSHACRTRGWREARSDARRAVDDDPLGEARP